MTGIAQERKHLVFLLFNCLNNARRPEEMRYEGTDDENYHRCCLTLLYVDDTIIHG